MQLLLASLLALLQLVLLHVRLLVVLEVMLVLLGVGCCCRSAALSANATHLRVVTNINAI